MWTSERRRELPVREPAAELGEVTLGGDPAGVSLGGERRGLEVYGPGGYCWRPAAGEKVLVLKAGTEGESPYILGVRQGGGGLLPGEVQITGGGGAALVRLGRRLDLNGPIWVNGQTLKSYIQQIVGEMLA